MDNQILIKATELLSYLFSFEKINELADPIKDELENGQIIPIINPQEEFFTFCHEITIYRRIENLTIELAILLRRLFETSGRDINELVKYKNPGNIYRTGKPINFKQALNKIIHSIKIIYEVKEGESNPSCTYLYGKDVKFTGNLYVDTDGEPSEYIINMIEVCLNALILSSIDF